MITIEINGKEHLVNVETCIEIENMQNHIADLENYIHALESNTSKSVIRRLQSQTGLHRYNAWRVGLYFNPEECKIYLDKNEALDNNKDTFAMFDNAKLIEMQITEKVIDQ